jgi:hypothetical protein
MSGMLEWFRSATWHYGSSGMGPGQAETQVKLLTCGFMSYYDPAFKSLASDRSAKERNALNLSTSGLWQGPGPKGNRTRALQDLTRRRRNHTLAAIDAAEAPLMNAALASFLRALNSSRTDHTPYCTGVDWSDLSRVISVRYSLPLRQLLHLLASPPPPSANDTIARRFLAQARYKSHALLMPFMEYPSSTVINSTFEESEWTLESKTGEETFSRCKYSSTRLLHGADGRPGDGIGRQEKVIAETTEEVLAAICSVIIQIGFQIEYEWLSRWNSPTATAKQTWSPSIIDQSLVLAMAT